MKSPDTQLTLDYIHRLLDEFDDEESPELEEDLQDKLKLQLSYLHYADIADLLEGLPLDHRLLLWDLLGDDLAARVLLEVSQGVQETLVESLSHKRLSDIATRLNSDELADITPYLSTQEVSEIINALDENARAQYEAARQYPSTQVGALMDFDMLKVREDVSCKVVLRYLRRFDELPPHTDKIFVVDDYNRLIGVLPLRKLLVSQPKEMVRDLFTPDPRSFHPHDDVEEVAGAFERYNLITAPVVDHHHRLIGRITIDEMVDVMKQAGTEDMLGMAGVSGGQDDLFSPILSAFKSRWLWLAINLATAFFASRVIGVFEDEIIKIVALASLMPIVAGIGGNAGNQTITMIVRAMASQNISRSQIFYLLRKEIAIALINGIVWGSLLALITYLLYDNLGLSGVILLAMTLNLILAALMGVLIPATMEKLGRDPALGSSVLITACTDSGGFFIFLSLAYLFLN